LIDIMNLRTPRLQSCPVLIPEAIPGCKFSADCFGSYASHA
jgi:hypothetical protein